MRIISKNWLAPQMTPTWTNVKPSVLKLQVSISIQTVGLLSWLEVVDHLIISLLQGMTA